MAVADFTGFAEKNKNKAINVVILVVTSIIALNIYTAQMRSIGLLKKQKADEAKKNEVLQSISSFELRLNSFRKLFSRKDPSAMINTVSSIANSLGIKIASIRPIQEQKFSEYVRLPFELSITVPKYHTLGSFISKLENHPDAFSVESIEINSSEQNKDLAVRLVVSNITLLD